MSGTNEPRDAPTTTTITKTTTTTTEPKKQEKKPANRMASMQSLKDDPPEIPLTSIITFEPQLLQIAGRIISILNEQELFSKIKKVIHKKFDVSIKKLDNELQSGGGETYFTEKECSFFSDNRVI